MNEIERIQKVAEFHREQMCHLAKLMQQHRERIQK